jgi:hypothetical protein
VTLIRWTSIAVSARRARSLLPLAALLGAASCMGAEREHLPIELLPDDRVPPLALGRGFDVLLYDDDRSSSRHLAIVGAEDPLVEELLAHVRTVCTGDVGAATRFSRGVGYVPPRTLPRTTGELCGVDGAREQQVLLCTGYRLLSMSESVVPVDVRVDREVGTTSIRPRQLLEEEPDDVAPIEMTLPVQGASESATLALLATVAFQKAALLGAQLLDPAHCADGFNYGTLPPYDGHDATERVPLSFVIATATGDALLQLSDAGDRARDRVAAAAAERSDGDRDRGRAARRLFRGEHDSLLEAARVLVAVPERSFDRRSRATVGGDDMEQEGEHETCEDAAQDDEDERAESLVMELAVDPRLTFSELAGGAAEARVRAALAEDRPATFGTPAMSALSDEAFFRDLGISPLRLRSATARVARTSEVMGRPISPVEGSSAAAPRVRGTSRSTRTTPPAVLFGRTAGRARLGHVQGDRHAPVGDYGTFGVLDPPGGYGTLGVLDTIDVVGTALAAAASRSDARRTDVGRPTFDETLESMTSARVFARERVPMRVESCMGQPRASGMDRVRFRVYTSHADASRYELWIGEAGLECATGGRVEGEPCAERDHRVGANATLRNDGTSSGFGRGYVEWVVDGRALPGGAASDPIRPGTVFYVTEGGSSAPSSARESRRAVAAVESRPGDDVSGEWSDCTMMPGGAELTREVATPITPSPEDCTEPALTCGDILHDVRIPLEDEIVEALDGSGGDDLDTSWVHYLRVAEEAANEADAIGENLVEQGLEMDLRAEAAAEQLEALCGDAVNVTSLPGIAPSEACSADGDCDAGYGCIAGFCQPTDVTAFLTTPGDSLDRCLGLGGELTNASLGSEPFCVWRNANAVPCDAGSLGDWDDPASIARDVCSGEVGGVPVGCPTCPFLPGTGGCEDHPDIDESSLPASFDLGEVEPLYLVDAGYVPPAGASDCIDFLRAMTRDGPDPTVLPNALDGAWLSHASALSAAQAVTLTPGPLNLIGAELGGGAWFRLGSLTGGPSRQWPCASRLTPEQHAEFCTGGGVQPIACGYDCSTFDSRSYAGWNVWNRIYQLHQIVGLTPQHVLEDLRTYQGDGHMVFQDLPAGILDDSSICNAIDLFPTCLRTGCEGPGDCSGEVQLATLVVPGQPTGQCIYGIDVVPTMSTDYRLQHAFCPEYMLPGQRVGGDVESAGQDAVWRPNGLVDQAVRRYYGGESQANDAIHPSHFSILHGGQERLENVVERWQAEHGETPYRPHLYSYGDVLHALELACWASADAGAGGGCPANLDELPPVSSVEDLDGLAARLECVADRYERVAAGLTLTDLPSDVADQLRSGGIEPSYPAYRGHYGQVVAELRAALESIPASNRQVASVVRDFAGVIALTRSDVSIQLTEDEIVHWQLVGQQANEVARCVSAVAGIASMDWAAAAGAAVSATAQCVASIIQMQVATETAVLQTTINDIEIKQALLQAVTDFGQRIDALAAAEQQLKEGYARVNGLLAQLAQIRAQAQREVAKILFLDSDETGREYAVNSVMRTRMSTLRIRYERALARARKLSCLARFGVEQRLGVDLSSEHFAENMTLVDAPVTWADHAASMGGIDYRRIRGELEGPISDYADEYIGDYVQNLEMFLESYRLDMPFENGSDLAVISLRDDVHRVRESCDVESYNLLSSSFDPQPPSWIWNCEPGERCPVIGPVDGNAFRAIPDGTGGTRVRDLGGGDALLFGAGCPEDQWDPIAMTCAAVPGGRLYQSIPLETGSHLVSWYEALPSSLDAGGTHAAACTASCTTSCGMDAVACIDACADACVQSACAMEPLPSSTPAVELVVRGTALDPLDLPEISVPPAFLDPASDRWVDRCRWRRVYARLEVPADQAVEVGFRVTVDPSDLSQAVSIGWSSPQIEALSAAEASVASIAPLAYFPTDDDRIAPLARCEDVDGSTFRSDHYWRRGCDYVCPDGIGASCAASATPDRSLLRCYWETEFTLSQHRIEQGELMPTGGFAVGNFNYRHARIGVNLVGTNVRDCAGVASPSSCYASGFIPYTLDHTGPFTVRNHFGDEVEARLYDGRIEHAKALTAERYLTNPLSSADRALLDDYWRSELRGRTLPGHYRLRIYDAPGLEFENLEDVQLLFGYQYWTRFE